jgi:hypothetical protein
MLPPSPSRGSSVQGWPRRPGRRARGAKSLVEVEREGKLAKLSVPELQAMYREVISRQSSSSSSADLVWKLRQAQKGRIRVGPMLRKAVAACSSPEPSSNLPVFSSSCVTSSYRHNHLRAPEIPVQPIHSG